MSVYDCSRHFSQTDLVLHLILFFSAQTLQSTYSAKDILACALARECLCSSLHGTSGSREDKQEISNQRRQVVWPVVDWSDGGSTKKRCHCRRVLYMVADGHEERNIWRGEASAFSWIHPEDLPDPSSSSSRPILWLLNRILLYLLTKPDLKCLLGSKPSQLKTALRVGGLDCWIWIKPRQFKQVRRPQTGMSLKLSSNQIVVLTRNAWQHDWQELCWGVNLVRWQVDLVLVAPSSCLRWRLEGTKYLLGLSTAHQSSSGVAMLLGALKLGSAEGGHPGLFRFLPIWNPICDPCVMDLFWFAPSCRYVCRTEQNKSGEPLSALIPALMSSSKLGIP